MIDSMHLYQVKEGVMSFLLSVYVTYQIDLQKYFQFDRKYSFYNMNINLEIDPEIWKNFDEYE